MKTNSEITWYQQLSDDLEYKVEDAKIAFAVELSKQIEHEGIIRRELADNIGSSPAYITKVLRGESNLTIESMIKLSVAAKGELHIHVTPRNSSMRWFGLYVNQAVKDFESGSSWAKTTKSIEPENPLEKLGQRRCNEPRVATA